MRVFSDFHHDALYRSLQYLFEKRLGWELHRPVGTDWFEAGFWKLAEPYGNNPATVEQYLGLRSVAADGTRRLNNGQDSGGGYWELSGNPPHKAVTLAQFREMKFDIIIASHPYHLEPYRRLIRNYQPGAKLILQMGNEWRPDFSLVKNLMASTKPFEVPADVNAVFYHQEFDTSLYSPSNEPPKPVCRSFVNTLATADLFIDDWRLFQEMEKANPQFRWESYGAGCRDGNVSGQKEVARLMKESAYGVMFKTSGDGFGHVLWNWAFCGRPLIVRGHQYKNKLGETILKDGLTCIDIDGLSMSEVREKIEYYFNEERYKQMCYNMYRIAKENCDFEIEEFKIRDFLAKLF